MDHKMLMPAFNDFDLVTAIAVAGFWIHFTLLILNGYL
jgi:hypothetical protein